jgi:hypothetical protein
MYIRSWIVSHVPLHPYPLLLNKGQGYGVLNAIFHDRMVIGFTTTYAISAYHH